MTVEETNQGVMDGLKAFFNAISTDPPNMNLEADYTAIIQQFNNRIANSIVNTYLIDEWDYENNTVDPKYVTTGETKNQYYWKCKKCNKPYLSSPYNRFVRKTGHTECSNRDAVRHNKRRVINTDTGEVFECIADAERKYGKPGNTSISCCCRHIYKTAYSFHWKYEDEERMMLDIYNEAHGQRTKHTVF